MESSVEAEVGTTLRLPIAVYGQQYGRLGW